MKRKPANLPALCLVALLLAPVAAAHARSSDRNQPMNVDADSSSCSTADDGPCVLTGNVKAVQGTLVINAAKADIRRAGGDISTVQLTGSQATIKQELDDGSPFNGRANKIDYDMPKDTVVLTGNAFVDKAGDTIKSERIVYNMKSGQVESGGTGGRVSMQLQPKNKDAGAAPAPSAPKPASKPAPAKPAPAKKGGG
ncbi:lipopolysaccharide transport periplasmic protein LptA [Lysobacter enzymogenes]|uniref:lipopolysaccharide transport periplasmic protein LptA n=1 Tax=Lysobacter enzymogenes TaxID=69 RepID=UPI001A96C2A3|nr:lipopolysaccharide transport periplasmic protein LptA [Lysobacter enzymogenes]QQP95960.1 lipopolysaccharide transport periplasmic protein LptA [Lysobacter enzymogenes]